MQDPHIAWREGSPDDASCLIDKRNQKQDAAITAAVETAEALDDDRRPLLNDPDAPKQVKQQNLHRNG
jgi:hypothetical protein